MGPASPATFGGAPQIRRICIAPGVRNLPPRTTGSVPRIEQCVCHRGSESRASRRTTYELGCRSEGLEISRETIMKRRSPVLDREALAAEIASLSKLGIDELRECWKA